MTTTFVCYTELSNASRKSLHTQNQDKGNDSKPFEIQPIISKTLFTQYRLGGLVESVKDRGQKSLQVYWMNVQLKQWNHSHIKVK